jgi:hypothetical protein
VNAFELRQANSAGVNRQGFLFRMLGSRTTHCLLLRIHAPECSKKKLPLGGLVVHLNDAHDWTRERIAVWVADPDVPQHESPTHH